MRIREPVRAGNGKRVKDGESDKDGGAEYKICKKLNDQESKSK